MKIAFIVGEFPTLSQTFILNQITGLIDLGHEVDIYSCASPTQGKVHPDAEKYKLYARTYYLDEVPENKIKRILKALRLLAINFHKSPLTILNSLNIFKYGREALSLYFFYHVVAFLRKQYDIIHCHFGPNGNFGAILKQLGIKGKLITTFHGYDTRLGIEKGGDIYQNLFKRGDCFIAVSDYNYKNLINFGLDEKKIIYHPVGIDVRKFPYRWNRKTFTNLDKIRIITVARLVEEKGLQYGIKVIRHLLEHAPKLNLRYEIIGEGNLKNYLEVLIHELGLDEIVHLLGSQTQDKVSQKLQESHIFLLPSVAESFGVVLLEAQAVGLPVVATIVGSVPQAIINGESGFLVPERDVNALAERINYLIEHTEIWPEMGRVGRKFVEEHYDIRKLNIQLVRIYEGLLSKKS